MPRSHRLSAHADLVRRMPARVDDSTAALHRALHGTAEIVKTFHGVAEQVTSAGKYSPAGILEELASHYREKVAPVMADHRRAIEIAKAQLAGRRDALHRREVDRSDVIAEMQRAELRTFLRGLPMGDRIQAALSGDAAMRDAILGGPAALSGLNEEVFGRVRDAALIEEKPDALRALVDLDEAIAVAQAAVTMTERELGALVGDGAKQEVAA